MKAILIGAGARGTAYARSIKHACPNLDLVGVANPGIAKRNSIKEQFDLPDSACFASWEQILAQPKMGDIAIISTQDRMHFAPAMKAIELGYHLLLEKPIAPTPEECIQIMDAANAKGVQVIICHTLRFTNFWRLIKKLIDTDTIGRIINIDHIAALGIFHYAHSFVRGDWRNSELSSPICVGMNCHDLDLLQWLIGKRCTRVQSFGSLTYFTKENKPEGAPEYCIRGCPVADQCIQNAETIYLKRKLYRRSSTKKHEPTEEDVLHCISNSGWGKCVYQTDNNVADHQIVNMEYEDGALVSMTISPFNLGGRKIRIMGTKGELYGEMRADSVFVSDYQTGNTVQIKVADALRDGTITCTQDNGENAMMYDFCSLLTGQHTENELADINISAESHLIAFAAEESRANGTVVNMNMYLETLRNNLKT